MARRYHSVAETMLDESKADFHNSKLAFKFESLARTALQILRSPKEWAANLDVTSQQVSQWKNGAKIPTERRMEIVTKAKIFFCDLNRIEDEIDRALLAAYGPADKGRF